MACVALPSGRVGLLQLPQTGRRPPEDVVMIHGLGASCGFWYASAVQWFRRFGRVTLFDLPGHGESVMPPSGYAPATLAVLLAELLDNLQIDRVHLVAHSFGGAVALAFAVHHPHRVKSLVLADVRLWAIEPPTGAAEAAPWVQRAREAGLTLADPRFDVSVQVLVELAQMRLAQGEPGEILSDVLPGARSLFRGRRTARRWLQLIETTRAYDEMTDPAGLALADIARIEAPMFALYGGSSGRERSALALHEVCPACHLQVIPHAGHFFPLTRPPLFARPALAFLRAVARNKVLAPRRRRRTSLVEAGILDAKGRPRVPVSRRRRAKDAAEQVEIAAVAFEATS